MKPQFNRLKRSKRMKGKGADPLAALRVLTRAAAAVSQAPLDASQTRDLGIGYHGALENLRTGRGTWDDANTLALACNVALLLAEQDIGREYMVDVLEAQAAIVVMAKRGMETGRYAFTGPQLQAVVSLLYLHDAQLACDECTSAVMVAALAECKRRMKAGNTVETV
jgi:hypothetical protein